MKRDIPDIHEFAAHKRLSLRQVMDFTTTVNPLGPSAKTRNAIRKDLKIVGRYPDRQARHLTSLIARMEGVPAENILVCESFTGLVSAILQASGAKTAIFPEPYPAYYRELLSSGSTQFSFSSLDEGNDFSFNHEKWLDEMAGHDAAILARPSFISASSPSREDLRKIVKTAGIGKNLLLIDETLREYSGHASLAGDILRSDRCLVVRSLSEYYALAGLPVAYAIGEGEALRQIRQLSSISPPNTLAATAAMAALRDRAYRDRTQVFMKQEHSFIEEGLRRIDGVSFFMTGCGFFVVSLNRSPSKPMETFLHYRIVVDELLVVQNTRFIFFPVKDHKWNARYLKTLKNIMGAPQR